MRQRLSGELLGLARGLVVSPALASLRNHILITGDESQKVLSKDDLDENPNKW